ncbi:tetratricopeptide repeat protein [Vacuolonema iberomarrocanum]|uniref:tetratricopeptide repeat protein n=1 Tax=Vacuolonema iberomarrocanum TaxID=3454632 RepID=UPI0019F5DB63|nr:tetratricopeptide repeat protein [filamentous cyanobacterium LEGE 07170]
MTLWNRGIRQVGCAMLSALAFGGATWMAAVPAVQAQVLFEEEGTLMPMEDEYTFEGEAGQMIKIAMTSDEFDTVLALRDASGQEIAFNDDSARSLNSTIITTLPADGTYTIVARSFSGQGGNYDLMVTPASEYDMAYVEGVEYLFSGDFESAIAAFSRAIELNPEEPLTYLDRGDTYYSMGNIEAVIADYTQAADLYEAQGNMQMAQMLREQLSFLESAPQPPM